MAYKYFFTNIFLVGGGRERAPDLTSYMMTLIAACLQPIDEECSSLWLPQREAGDLNLTVHQKLNSQRYHLMLELLHTAMIFKLCNPEELNKSLPHQISVHSKTINVPSRNMETFCQLLMKIYYSQLPCSQFCKCGLL